MERTGNHARASLVGVPTALGRLRTGGVLAGECPLRDR